VSESSTSNTSNGWELIKVVVEVIIAAILGFGFGTITARQQFLSDTQLQNQSYILEVRQNAYSNFFEGQAELVVSEGLEKAGLSDEAAKLRTEYNLSVKTSLFQIVMFGSKQVNEALANHFRTRFNYGSCGDDIQRWQNEARIYQSMRDEVFGNDNRERIDDNTILALLFKCTLP